MTAPALVHIAHLVKSYWRGGRRVAVLTDITLDIARGDFTALMGPSGSGKSTLLNLIAGIDKPDSGTLQIDGVALASLSEAELARWRAVHIGFVFQFYNLLPVLSAFENVELPLLLTRLPRAARRARVALVLGMVGLQERMAHTPAQLSGGEQQRVAIARAIVADPTLIVADEPTGDLDRAAAADVLGLLQRLNTELGKTIIMVTHDAGAAQRARTVIRLDKGELRAGAQAN